MDIRRSRSRSLASTDQPESPFERGEVQHQVADGPAVAGGSARASDAAKGKSSQQRLRWDSRALMRLADAVDRLDISKHWNYGSKTKFWYKVLRELAADEDRDNHLQPHINTLNQKFGEMYDAYEAGHLGLKLPPPAKGRLTSDDLPQELKTALSRIYEKFKHVRNHKVAISGNHVSQLRPVPPQTSSRKRKPAPDQPLMMPAGGGESLDMQCREAPHGAEAFYGRAATHEDLDVSQSYKVAAAQNPPGQGGNPYMNIRQMHPQPPNYGESTDPDNSFRSGHLPYPGGLSPYMAGYSLPAHPHGSQHKHGHAEGQGRSSGNTMHMLVKSMAQAVKKLDEYLEVARSELDLARKYKTKQAELANQQLALLEQKLQEDRRHRDCLQLLVEEQQRFLQTLRGLAAHRSSSCVGGPRYR
mmetsp:Transcript_32845/g.82363  ORF Transcript_32845/g.82363 Transcript_32845/m.82363 type:complete len:415 (-) Transcript_32845:384-1628(-)